jgi:hypothetical protein
LIAGGRARFTLYANLAGLIATLVFVPLVRPATPWEAVLVWCGVQMFVSPYSLWINARALGVGSLRPLRAGVPMLAVSLAAVAAAFALGAGGPLEVLIHRAVVFVLVVAAFGVPLLWFRRADYFGTGPSDTRNPAVGIRGPHSGRVAIGGLSPPSWPGLSGPPVRAL